MAKRTTRPEPAPIVKDRIVRFNYTAYSGEQCVGFYCNLPVCSNNECITQRDNRDNSPRFGELLNAAVASVISEKHAAAMASIWERQGRTVEIITVNTDKAHINATEYVNI